MQVLYTCKILTLPPSHQPLINKKYHAVICHFPILTVWPWKVLMGLSCPSLQTWIHMSVLQEANVLLLCQSTSNAGAKRTRYVKLWHVFCRNLLYKFSMHYYKCQQEATIDCTEVLNDSHSEQCEMQPKPIFQRKMRQNLIVTRTIYLKWNSYAEDNSKTISDSYLQINLQSPHQKQVPSA